MKELKLPRTSSTSTFVMAGVLACIGSVTASSVKLPLRFEPPTCTFNALTTQTVESDYGSALTALLFANTATYDFYSPPLLSPVSLVPSDKSGGTLSMRNTSASAANDFTVRGRMLYFDYDPSTGVDVLLGDTGASGNKNVNHNQTVNWALPNSALPAAATVPAGHLLHIVVSVTLIAGDPVSYGQLLVNGPAPATTVALFPQNGSVTWSFANLTPLPDATVSVSAEEVPFNSTGNSAWVPNTTGATYVWAITNGIITAGQGTSQITWSAGASAAVGLGVVVTKGCALSGSASVAVQQPVNLPQDVVSVTRLADGTTLVTCSGAASTSYLLQASSTVSPATWTTLVQTNTGLNGLFSFVDVQAANSPRRFYRTATP